jgi:hypothetical protein
MAVTGWAGYGAFERLHPSEGVSCTEHRSGKQPAAGTCGRKKEKALRRVGAPFPTKSCEPDYFIIVVFFGAFFAGFFAFFAIYLFLLTFVARAKSAYGVQSRLVTLVYEQPR